MLDDHCRYCSYYIIGQGKLIYISCVSPQFSAGLSNYSLVPISNKKHKVPAAMCGLSLSNTFRNHSPSRLSTNEKHLSVNQTLSTNRTYSTTQTYSTNRTMDADDYALPPARPAHGHPAPVTMPLPRPEKKRTPSTNSRQRNGKKSGIAPSISSIVSDQAPHAITSPGPIHSYAFTSTLHSAPSEREARWILGATNYVREYMQGFDSSHDFAHVQRVLKNAIQILHVESANNPSTRFDPTIVTLAALFHDVGDKKYRERHTLQRPKRLAFADEEPTSSSSDDVSSSRHHRHTNHSRPALHDSQLAALLTISHDDPETLVKRILLRLGAPQEVARTVQRIVKNISYSHEVLDPAHMRGVMLRHPELAIVQDADRLDAIGAIGIARCFTYGGAASTSSVTTIRKPSLSGANVAGTRISASTAGGGGGGYVSSTTPGRSLQESMDHFGEKLLRLEGMMKTREGKRLARVKTQRLHIFQEWWNEENGFDLSLL